MRLRRRTAKRRCGVDERDGESAGERVSLADSLHRRGNGAVPVNAGMQVTAGKGHIMELRISGTVNDSIVDGPGFRFAIFTQGCPHACPGCHNPQTHSMSGGELVDTQQLADAMKANPLLKGVTLTGGEPFVQPQPLIEIARWCHANGLDVWAYSGYTYEALESGAAGSDARELLTHCDVLVDGPFVESLKTMSTKWRGSSNQRVIDVKSSLQTGKVQEIA